MNEKSVSGGIAGAKYEGDYKVRTRYIACSLFKKAANQGPKKNRED